MKRSKGERFDVVSNKRTNCMQIKTDGDQEVTTRSGSHQKGLWLYALPFCSVPSSKEKVTPVLHIGSREI